LHITTGDAAYRLRIAPRDKSMKYELTQILNAYDQYTFVSPHIYLNSPNEMYSRDTNSYYSNKGRKIVYFIDPKQTMIHETLLDYGPEV
jgi:hypothetical protein